MISDGSHSDCGGCGYDGSGGDFDAGGFVTDGAVSDRHRSRADLGVAKAARPRRRCPNEAAD